VKNIGRILAPMLAAGLLGALGCREDPESPTAPESTPTPSTAAVPLSFRQVSMGYHHACGVTTADRAYCWGDGALGNGSTAPVDDYSTKPVAVVGGLSFRVVSAGHGHTCGLTTDDLAYCWGFNGYGNLGDGTRITRLQPVPVAGGRHFRQLRAGDAHTCAVTWSDVAFCWGDNTYGQLGDGTITQRLTPVPIHGGLFFQQLSTGYHHSCGVTDHRAYCWGRNRYGALGDGTFTRRLTPVAVAGGLRFSGVSAGNEYSCGVTTGKLAYCWGLNNSGGLGNGTTTQHLTPVAVSSGLLFASVNTSGFGNSTCGVTTGERAYCWGSNSRGQLGDGSLTDRLTPVAVVGP